MGLTPSVSHLNDGRAMVPPQEGGKLPDRGNPYSRIVDKNGKAPGEPQALGRDPALITVQSSYHDNCQHVYRHMEPCKTH